MQDDCKLPIPHHQYPVKSYSVLVIGRPPSFGYYWALQEPELFRVYRNLNVKLLINFDAFQNHVVYKVF